MAKKAKSAPKSSSKAAQKASSKSVKKTDTKKVSKASAKKPAKGKAKASPSAKKAAKAAPKKPVETPKKAQGKAKKAATPEKEQSKLKETKAAGAAKEAPTAPAKEAPQKKKSAQKVALAPKPSFLDEDEGGEFEDFEDESFTPGVEEEEEEFEAPAEPVEVEKAATRVTSEKRTRRRDEVRIDRSGNLEEQWRAIYEKTKGIKPVPYKMSDNYEARTPLMHKVLGWGYVLSSQNDRLEVLFKDGIKILIANYKRS